MPPGAALEGIRSLSRTPWNPLTAGTLSRVPLLPQSLLVALQDLVGDRYEGIGLGPWTRDPAAITGRLGTLEYLLESVPVDVLLAAGDAFV